jgi:hypothetical protein
MISHELPCPSGKRKSGIAGLVLDAPPEFLKAAEKSCATAGDSWVMSPETVNRIKAIQQRVSAAIEYPRALPMLKKHFIPHYRDTENPEKLSNYECFLETIYGVYIYDETSERTAERCGIIIEESELAHSEIISAGLEMSVEIRLKQLGLDDEAIAEKVEKATKEYDKAVLAYSGGNKTQTEMDKVTTPEQRQKDLYRLRADKLRGVKDLLREIALIYQKNLQADKEKCMTACRETLKAFATSYTLNGKTAEELSDYHKELIEKTVTHTFREFPAPEDIPRAIGVNWQIEEAQIDMEDPRLAKQKAALINATVTAAYKPIAELSEELLRLSNSLNNDDSLNQKAKDALQKKLSEADAELRANLQTSRAKLGDIPALVNMEAVLANIGWTETLETAASIIKKKTEGTIEEYNKLRDNWGKSAIEKMVGMLEI